MAEMETKPGIVEPRCAELLASLAEEYERSRNFLSQLEITLRASRREPKASEMDGAESDGGAEKDEEDDRARAEPTATAIIDEVQDAEELPSVSPKPSGLRAKVATFFLRSRSKSREVSVVGDDAPVTCVPSVVNLNLGGAPQSVTVDRRPPRRAKSFYQPGSNALQPTLSMQRQSPRPAWAVRVQQQGELGPAAEGGVDSRRASTTNTFRGSPQQLQNLFQRQSSGFISGGAELSSPGNSGSLSGPAAEGMWIAGRELSTARHHSFGRRRASVTDVTWATPALQPPASPSIPGSPTLMSPPPLPRSRTVSRHSSFRLAMQIVGASGGGGAAGALAYTSRPRSLSSAATMLPCTVEDPDLVPAPAGLGFSTGPPQPSVTFVGEVVVRQGSFQGARLSAMAATLPACATPSITIPNSPAATGTGGGGGSLGSAGFGASGGLPSSAGLTSPLGSGGGTLSQLQLPPMRSRTTGMALNPAPPAGLPIESHPQQRRRSLLRFAVPEVDG